MDTSLTGDCQIKQEPLILSDAEMHAMAKDRQKKDNHNMSESFYFSYLITIFKFLNFFNMQIFELKKKKIINWNKYDDKLLISYHSNNMMCI